MNYNVDPDMVINNLLEKNKAQTLQISILETAVTQLQHEIRVIRASVEDPNTMEI